MSLHTPESIWEKWNQPTLEVASDGIGVSLGENTYLYIRWNGELPAAERARWLAFFARSGAGLPSVEDVLGIERLGESSRVVSLSELRTGLELLTRVYDQVE